MTVNVELLDRTMAHIEAFPDEWEQGDYRCETGMCFAGWAAELAGGKWLDEVEGYDVKDAFLIAEEADDPSLLLEKDGYRVIYASHRARRLLGLTQTEALTLFDGDNDIERLQDLVERFKENV